MISQFPRDRAQRELVCQVDGCSEPLGDLKVYHKRYRICTAHSRSSALLVKGQWCRFCQQCGRFHELNEFEGTKRSCKARLERHNRRRRVEGIADKEVEDQADAIEDEPPGLGGSSQSVAAPAEQLTSSALHALTAPPGAQHQAAQGCHGLLGNSNDNINGLLSDSPAEAQSQAHGLIGLSQRSASQHQQQVPAALAQPAPLPLQHSLRAPASSNIHHGHLLQLQQQPHHLSDATQYGQQTQLLGSLSAFPAVPRPFLPPSAGVSTCHGALSHTSGVSVQPGMAMAGQMPLAQHVKREPFSTLQEVSEPAHPSVTSWLHTQPLQAVPGTEPQLSSLQRLSSAPVPSQGASMTASAAWPGAGIMNPGIITQQQVAQQPAAAAFAVPGRQASSSLLDMRTSAGPEGLSRAHSTSGLVQRSHAGLAGPSTEALSSSTGLGLRSPALYLTGLQQVQPQVQLLQPSAQFSLEQQPRPQSHFQQQQQQQHVSHLPFGQQAQQQQQQWQNQSVLADGLLQQQAAHQHASSPKEAVAWPSTPVQLSHDARLRRATFQERQFISDHSLVHVSATLRNLHSEFTESFLQRIGDSIVVALQVDVGPAHCEYTIVQSSARVVVTVIASHEAALAARTRGPVGTFNLLVAGPHADIWQGCSGQLQIGLDMAHFQQAQAHAAESACSNGPKIASLTPRCLSTAASHTLQASGRSLDPLTQYAVTGRFNGQAVELRAEGSTPDMTQATDAQAISIKLPPMPNSGVLYLDFVVKGTVCSSKQVLILQDAGAKEDLQGLASAGLSEDDIDALLLDLGQVLPYAEPGSSASASSAMSHTEAAWICPIALHLVRFARSRNWLQMAALIMPVAATGLALAAAEDDMDTDFQEQPSSHEFVSSPKSELLPSPEELDRVPSHTSSGVHLPTAVSLDLDRVPSPSTEIETQLP